MNTFGKVSSMLVLVVAGAVQANTMTILHNGYGAAAVVGFHYNGEPMYAYGGIYLHDKSAGTGEGNFWPDGTQTVPAFCMDIYQHNPLISTVYDVIPVSQGPTPHGPMGAVKADRLAELWGRFFDPSWVGPGPFTALQKQSAATFNVAIWEIIYEPLPSSPSLWDVTSGDFYTDGSVINPALANSWLHILDGTGPQADLRCLNQAGKQDFLVVVPEPATIGLLLLTAPFYLARKRSRT